MATTITSRKAAAEQFLKLVCSDVDRAYAELVAPGFRHHNVFFPGSAAALKAGMADNLRQFPQKRIDVKRRAMRSCTCSALKAIGSPSCGT